MRKTAFYTRNMIWWPFFFALFIATPPVKLQRMMPFGPTAFFTPQLSGFRQNFFSGFAPFFPSFPQRRPSSLTSFSISPNSGRGGFGGDFSNRFIFPSLNGGGRIISHPPIITEPIFLGPQPKPTRFLPLSQNNHEDTQSSLNGISNIGTSSLNTAQGLSSFSSGFGQTSLNIGQSPTLTSQGLGQSLQGSAQGTPFLTPLGFENSFKNTGQSTSSSTSQGVGQSLQNSVQGTPSFKSTGAGQSLLNTMQGTPSFKSTGAGQSLLNTMQGTPSFKSTGAGQSLLNTMQSTPALISKELALFALLNAAQGTTSLSSQGVGHSSLNTVSGSSFTAQNSAKHTASVVPPTVQNVSSFSSGRLRFPKQQEGRSLANNTLVAAVDPGTRLQNIVNSTLFYGSLFQVPPAVPSIVNNLTVLKRSQDVLDDDEFKVNNPVQIQIQ